MIKFFRKIRQRLLSENKFTRYLIYAVGEIILVVIGILIALQINNLNEARKDRIEEQKILIQLKEEYQDNLQQLDQKIEIRNLLIGNSNKILTFIEDDSHVNIDTLAALLGTLGLTPTFDPISNDIVSSGKLRLIQNEALRKSLSSWISDVVQLKEEEDYWVKSRDELWLPFLLKIRIARNAIGDYIRKETPTIFLPSNMGNTKIDIGKSANPPTVQEILSNPELEGILTVVITYNHIGNLQSKVLREKILEILELIDAGISN